ncbi:pyridoxamine 5'-phosphate oxidase family protein [Georgenia sp. SYP-B2076]|uniref:pyridoxamine 5'-phosphate oxidase family protein n=1 Tax=Georgenia sp. SYP-B2076 TaxID=2495881 RepID=UPI000F8D7ED8|nr:pyridoxamine 5'-phosphate oxidase family protein [Georgenia sp. SYP-B2076]
MTPDDVAALMQDPVAQRLLSSANPARLAYVARDGSPRVVPVGFDWNGTTIVVGTVPGSAKVGALEANPAVALTIDTSPPAWPPNVLLIRGTASVTVVDGVFPEYVAGARKLTPADEFPSWEAGVRALYDQMARIDITPTWVAIHDFETRLPHAVEELARSRFGHRGGRGRQPE